MLGHAALAHGLLFFYKSDIKEKYTPTVANWPALFIRIAIICIPVGIFFQNVNGLAQFAVAAEGLSFVAATLAFAIAIPQRKIPVILLSGALYGFGLAQALVSGFKEPVIVSVIMMGILLYPFYKRTVVVVFIPLMLFLFMVLPTYVNTFRQQSWGNDQHEDAAKSQALQKVRDELSGDNLKKTNWIFLTTRISEIEMFVKYRKGVEKHGFYRLQIVKQSLLSIIPRFLWPGKPVTENLAMERAFDNNIVDRIARVSAKPAFLVDGYLSGGAFGVWLSLFLYGAIAQLVCNKADNYLADISWAPCWCLRLYSGPCGGATVLSLFSTMCSGHM